MKDKTCVSLVFPHQLFKENPCLSKGGIVYLIEEFLFFKQYSFHKQKILLHRASMKFYGDYLKKMGFQVNYVDSLNPLSDVRELIPALTKEGVKEVCYVEVVDNWLEKRIEKTTADYSISKKVFASPMFLNSMEELSNYFKNRKNFFQTDFYMHQRKQRNILIDANKKPIGGKWTYDSENRLKYPKDKVSPRVHFPVKNKYVAEAEKYVKSNYNTNYGEIDSDKFYPVTFGDSRVWLEQFLKERFNEFGPYEDSVVVEEHFLNHSILTPMLNTGLLTPQEVTQVSLEYAGKNDIPLNSLEGFIRQVIGWREFIRAVYELKGSQERTKNFWGFKRKIPPSFWKGNTGIGPIDTTIKKVLKNAYCHHIERLMILGNFMLLCEFDPNEVYTWFMELFIDSYDWVMVPNVYGMSQFADGGVFATKPYISSSNYLKKMSNYPKGDWQSIWDSLFWRFMHVHRDFFSSNPRLGMLLKTLDKMDERKRHNLITKAEEFLATLDK